MTTPQFSCIKEKYGSLRIYADYIEDEVICNLIDEAGFASEKVCEICGEAGRLLIYKDNWYRTRCVKHVDIV